MLPADVYARFQRAKGHETLLICATDEHGTPAELAALEAGQPIEAYCREWHEVQKARGRAIRALVGLFRPLLQPAESPN